MRRSHQTTPTFMMPLKQLKLYELGRPLGKQGPRQDLRPRGPGDKSATVDSKAIFKILQLNANGLGTAKAWELRKLLSDENIKVALIQETMLKGKDISIPGYTPYKCKCQDNCQGILTLIRNDVQAEVCNIKTNGNDLQHIKFWENGKCFTLYNIYSPPNVAFDAQLQSINFQRTILLGDTNAHSPLWGYRDTNPSGKYIEEICTSTNLILLQDKDSETTHYHRPSGTYHRPDHTLVSADIHDQCSWKVLDDFGSDHSPILISLEMEKIKGKPKRRAAWNYTKANWTEFRNVSEPEMLNIDTGADEDTFDTEFSKTILQAAEKTIPKGNRAKYKVFWNSDLAEAVNLRKKAWKIRKKRPGPERTTEYNRLAANSRRISKASKNRVWEKSTGNLDFRKDGGRKAHRLLDKLSGKTRRTNPVPIETENGKACTDSQKAKAFNKFFATVNKSRKRKTLDKAFKKLTKRMERMPRCANSIFAEKFTPSELESSLKKCKRRKAPGPDKVTNDMLVQLGKNGKKVLLKLINKTWKSGKLPKSWKTAHIIPVLKKDKPKTKLNSYRPISLTSCIGKLAERMINQRLYWWLEKVQVLNAKQSGFRRGRQTIDQLIRLTQ